MNDNDCHKCGRDIDDHDGGYCSKCDKPICEKCGVYKPDGFGTALFCDDNCHMEKYPQQRTFIRNEQSQIVNVHHDNVQHHGRKQ